MKDGVNFSINTDDPVVLGNTLTDDYHVAKRMGLSNKDIIMGVSNILLLNICFFSIFPLYFCRFVRNGANFSINTDAPIVTGCTLANDYQKAMDMGLTRDDIVKGVGIRQCYR